MWNASPTAAVVFPRFQFELNEFRNFQYIIYLVLCDKNVTPKSPIVIHLQFAICSSVILSVNFYIKFLNQSLQLLYSTVAKVYKCYEPEYIIAKFQKLWNYV
jgi:hypothetical protein